MYKNNHLQTCRNVCYRYEKSVCLSNLAKVMNYGGGSPKKSVVALSKAVAGIE